MNVNLQKFIGKGETIAVALSGGSDSMALLHYLNEQSKILPFNLLALNVEHGIRGENSKSDSKFVKEYCEKNNIPLLCYAVDALKRANEDKLTLEQSARVLRYECFYDALSKNKCDKIATAHHKKDNAESVLLNLFRGTGLKGLVGINENFENKIIRPFLSLEKQEIDDYIAKNNIPFVTDESNFCDDYKRNYVRLNVLPIIEKAFPDYQNKIYALSSIAKEEDEYLDKLASEKVCGEKSVCKITLPCEKVLFNRAVIIALKKLGIKKDWTKTHVELCYGLTEKENGAKLNLLCGVNAIKEYDKICFYVDEKIDGVEIPFKEGEFDFNGARICVEKAYPPLDLKNGLYIDGDKVPDDAVIREKNDGDIFTKFGGGTKSLGDYLTDKKIPLRIRDTLPIIAYENVVYAIFGVAISELIKVDETTKTIYKISVK